MMDVHIGYGRCGQGRGFKRGIYRRRGLPRDCTSLYKNDPFIGEIAVSESESKNQPIRFTMTPAKLILKPILSTPATSQVPSQSILESPTQSPINSPLELSSQSPSQHLTDEENITIDTALVPSYTKDWDSTMIGTKSNIESTTHAFISPAEIDEDPHKTPSYKMWHIMKLREKLNFLRLNDRGNRAELIGRLDHYYASLPNRISESNNPWISDDLENLLEDVQIQQQQDKNEPVVENSNLLSSLLVEIVNILEVISLPRELNKPPKSNVESAPSPPQQEDWQLAQKTYRPKISEPHKIQLKNRYKSLEVENNSNEQPILYNNANKLCNENVSNKNRTNKTRPTICETAKYVKNMNERQPIRPGIHSYSKAATSSSTISVVTDSMCRSIRNAEINSHIDNSTENIKIYKFPGAHSHQIQHYSKWTIEHDEPDAIVIVCGTNDISYDKNPLVEEISNKVLDIARQAKQMGVGKVFICGIVFRKNKHHDDIIRDINLALRLVSTEEGFIFIDNENIHRSDLNGDGLHLNPNGTNKLMRNILQHTCTTY